MEWDNATVAVLVNVSFTRAECSFNYSGFTCWPGDCSATYYAFSAGKPSALLPVPPGLICAGGALVAADSGLCAGTRRCFDARDGGVPEGEVPCAATPAPTPSPSATACNLMCDGGSQSGGSGFGAWWLAITRSVTSGYYTVARNETISTRNVTIQWRSPQPTLSLSPSPSGSASSSSTPVTSVTLATFSEAPSSTATSSAPQTPSRSAGSTVRGVEVPTDAPMHIMRPTKAVLGMRQRLCCRRDGNIWGRGTAS